MMKLYDALIEEVLSLTGQAQVQSGSGKAWQ